MGVVVAELPGDSLPDNRLVWVVDDPLQALQDLAAAWRRKHELTVVGITGSIGKTTVKEATAWTLEDMGSDKVLKSEANLNTEIGLPLELLKLNSNHKVAVLEMGMHARGDIALLAKIAGPNIGVITNVLPVHLERTGSIERTAQGKAELAHALPANGLGVFNGDDRLGAGDSAFQSLPPPLLYGRSPSRYDFWAENIKGHGRNGFEADFRHGGRKMHREMSPARGPQRYESPARYCSRPPSWA